MVSSPLSLDWLQAWLRKWQLPILNSKVIDVPIIDKELLVTLRTTLNGYLSLHPDCVIPLIPEWGACAKMCTSGMVASVRKKSRRRLVLLTRTEKDPQAKAYAFDVDSHTWYFVSFVHTEEWLGSVLDCRFFSDRAITVPYQLVDVLVIQGRRAPASCVDRISVCNAILHTSKLVHSKIFQAIVSTGFNILPTLLILDQENHTTITLLDYDWFTL
jgi:hypothetical protein